MLDRRKPYVLRIRDAELSDKEYKKAAELWEQDPPVLAINVSLARAGRGYALKYLELGSGRGHVFYGRVVKEMKNGIMFEGAEYKATFALTELTYEEFERRIRPRLSEWERRLLNDLDDVQTYYRRIAGMV